MADRTDTQDEAAARRYIDRIEEINRRHGLGDQLTPEAYERAVREAARAVAPLASRARH